MDIVIPRTTKRKRQDEDTASVISLVGTDGTVHRTTRTTTIRRFPQKKEKSQDPNVKVIEILDPKAIKQNIVLNWAAHRPAAIVKLIKRLYPNLGTRSVQLSNLKSLLAQQKPKPPQEFLDKLKLTKAEYKSIRDAYRKKRDKESFNMIVIQDGALLVKTALELIVSSDFRQLWAAAILVSGLRPIEILTVKVRLTPQNTSHQKPEYWVCVSGWAKKSHSKNAVKRDFCRDHPLLCPSWLFCRALKIIRAHFCKERLTKRGYHNRYNRYWLQLLQKGYPQLIKPTHVLMRRAYAKISYLYFENDFPNAVNETSFISFVLGHTSMEPALSYSNLRISNLNPKKFNIFDIGHKLKVSRERQSGRSRHVQ
jgi:hypothetical protein